MSLQNISHWHQNRSTVQAAPQVIPAVTRPASEKSAYPRPILLTAVPRLQRAPRQRRTTKKYRRSSGLSKTDEKPSLGAQKQTTNGMRTWQPQRICKCILTNRSSSIVGPPDARSATSLLSIAVIRALASLIPQNLRQNVIVAAFSSITLSLYREEIFLLHDDG